MKPFNLEEAKKKGVKSLVYRNGEIPVEVFFSEHKKEYPIMTIDIQGNLITAENNGRSYNDGYNSAYDLFMVEEEMWVNVYEIADGFIQASEIYESKEDAEKGKHIVNDSIFKNLSIFQTPHLRPLNYSVLLTAF